MIRLAICLPTMGSPYAPTMGDLAALCMQTAVEAKTAAIESVSLHQVQGTYLPLARQQLAEKALRQGATHVLWLDGDMRFPPDAGLRLLGHSLSYVGANYATKSPPIVPTATRLDGRRMQRGSGLEEALVVAPGACLVAAAVYAAIEPPWYDSGYRNRKWRGEDQYFCALAREAGFRLWVDHELSHEVRHAGRVEYGDNDMMEESDAST